MPYDDVLRQSRRVLCSQGEVRPGLQSEPYWRVVYPSLPENPVLHTWNPRPVAWASESHTHTMRGYR